MNYTHTDTDHQKEGEYPKLVRDNIPEIIKANHGVAPPLRILDDAEFRTYLLQKLGEEAEELAKADSPANVREELADVLEIIDAFLEFESIDEGEVRRIQAEKREKRGGFKDKILLLDNK